MRESFTLMEENESERMHGKKGADLCTNVKFAETSMTNQSKWW
jgi:hypothetical protein